MTKFLLLFVYLSAGHPVTEHTGWSEYAACMVSRENLLITATEQRQVVLVAECFIVPPSWGMR